MRRSRLVFIPALAASIFGLAAAANAQDAAPYDWRGFYVGVHVGAGLGLVDVKDPFGSSIFGDVVRVPGPLAGGQLGYNWQFGSAVLGLEAEASGADMDGTNTCFAYSGFYISSNCHAHIDALGTFTGRFGWALPGDGRTLLYGKAGLAWEHASTDAYVNRETERLITGIDGIRWGYALGAGLERALSSRWSFKTEYDYLGFGSEDFAAPESHYQTVVGSPGTIVTVPQTATSVSQGVHQLKVGLNYRFGDGERALDPAWEWGDRARRTSGHAPPPPGTELEAGVRYVYGWGRFQKDQGSTFAQTNINESRLTYANMTTNGKEAFARLDAPFNVMVKGFIGIGKGGGGSFNDEDWGLNLGNFIPYSNTTSGTHEKITYATIDVGYDVWRSAETKIAPFVGYSYFRQDMHNGGCHQIGDPHSDCHTPNPPWIISVEDLDTWKSVRVGAAVDTLLAPRLKASADIAYLPHVDVSAVNHHYLRGLVSPEWGDGKGVQLEGLLSYALIDGLNVGIGGRYWSMWTSSGETAKSAGTYPMRFATEQAALLVQGSYNFDALWTPDAD